MGAIADRGVGDVIDVVILERLKDSRHDNDPWKEL